MTKFDGNVEITKETQKGWAKKLKDVTEISGYLHINSNAKLDSLKSVGGNLYINSNAKLDSPKLESVGGNLYINSNAKLDSLKSVGGYLYINSNAKLDSLESVGGNLSIYSNAKLDSPKLESVGGYLHINSNAKLDSLKSVGGNLYINSNAKLDSPKLESVGGNLYINSNAKLDSPKLESVGGDLSINSKLDDSLLRRLWNQNKKNKWYLTELAPDWILDKKGNFTFKIGNVEFAKKLFDEIRKDKLTAKQVFSIKNIEQRRIAYEFMDKSKMKALKNYTVLDKKTDKFGNEMKIISFNVEGYTQPFKYLHCVCPSTKREYFLETKQDTCEKAKSMSFGLQEMKFDEEY